MRLMHWGPDGGKSSGVMGLFFIELKSLFSVVLLRFSPGEPERYHSHAFNAVSFFIKGFILERVLNPTTLEESWHPRRASIFPKYTPRDRIHSVEAPQGAWCLTLRGPWVDRWVEYRGSEKKRVELTNGRVEVENAKS